MERAETKFELNEDGDPWTEKFRQSKTEWFRFVTRTKIVLESGSSITMRTDRRMHTGLFEHFMKSVEWRKQILRENQSHALAEFNG